MPESQWTISAVLSVGESNPSFATWNSATPLGTAAVLVNNDYSYNTLVVSFNQTLTITSGQLTFQGSLDNVFWFTLEGIVVSTSAMVGPTFALGTVASPPASVYSVFSFNLTGIPYFQVLLSQAIVGSGSLTIGYAADSFVNSMATSGGSNPSVGPNGQPIPLETTLIGSQDSHGNLQPASAANPVPVTNVISSTGEPPTNMVIGTSSALVLATNALRKGVNICNIGFGTTFLSFGSSPAVLYSGVTLGPGGTFWMDATDFTTAAINAISTQANATIAVQEFE